MKLIKTKTASSFLYRLIFFPRVEKLVTPPGLRTFAGYHFENTSQALFSTGKIFDEHKFSRKAKKTTMAF